MAAPVNLNRYRKQKARAAKKAHAEENVARSGRSKLQKEQENTEANKARRDLDGHELDP